MKIFFINAYIHVYVYIYYMHACMCTCTHICMYDKMFCLVLFVFNIFFISSAFFPSVIWDGGGGGGGGGVCLFVCFSSQRRQNFPHETLMKNWHVDDCIQHIHSFNL